METSASTPTLLHTRLQCHTTHVVTMGGTGNVAISFDLSAVDMTPEQATIVRKLFNQHPVAVASEVEHRRAQEAGQDGPAAQYLTRDEFQSIRTLGIRLGTEGVLAATACDFCLHCVKLEALPGPLL